MEIAKVVLKMTLGMLALGAVDMMIQLLFFN